MADIDSKGFLIRRSDLTTRKLFVEFYLPESQALIATLRSGAYEVKPMREIASRIFDGPFGSDRTIDMYQDSGIPYIRVKDVLPGMIARDGLTYISPEKHQLLSRCRVVPGNVLLTIAGRLGTAAVFPEDLVEGNITGHIAGIEPKDNVNSDYLALYLNSRFGESQFTRWGHRTTRPELNLREIGEILVVVPPRDLQDRIAQVMQDAYATRRAKLERARVLWNDLDNIVVRRLDLNLSNLSQAKRFHARVAQLRRWDLTYNQPYYLDLEHVIATVGYPVHQFGKIATFCSDLVDPSKNPDDPITYIEIGDVDSLTCEVTSSREILGKDAPSRARRLVRTGDIVTGVSGVLTGTKGQSTFIVPPEFDGAVVSTGFAVLRPKHGIVSEYIFSLLISDFFLKMIWRRKTGAAIPAISDADFKSIPTPVPSHRIQATIASEVCSLRQEAKRFRSEAETIVAESQARVERMILGEERVP